MVRVSGPPPVRNPAAPSQSTERNLQRPVRLQILIRRSRSGQRTVAARSLARAESACLWAKGWAHCFGGNSCYNSGLQATRRSCRSQSQNVDREIRPLWRVFTRGRIRHAQAAQSVGYLKCRRSVRFLAPCSCCRPHQDRVFFAGLVVSYRRLVGFDTRYAAISARSISSSANSTHGR